MNEFQELKEMMNDLGLHFDITFELKAKDEKLLLERVTGIYLFYNNYQKKKKDAESTKTVVGSIT